jgi:hypothetical protein
MADAFWEGRCGSQGTARQQPATEQRKTLTPLHSVPEGRAPTNSPRDPRARTLREEAHYHIRLDFIFRLRTGLTPSPTNGCKSAAFAPPSRLPSRGKCHDQSRRYSDVLLRQRVLCGSYSRGHNSACLTKGVRRRPRTGRRQPCHMCRRHVPACRFLTPSHFYELILALLTGCCATAYLCACKRRDRTAMRQHWNLTKAKAARKH